MMAPIYHPAMKIVSLVRKKLKVKTVFNILGPMLNPARVPYAVVGVYKEDLVGDSTVDSSNIRRLLGPSVIKISRSYLILYCWVWSWLDLGFYVFFSNTARVLFLVG